jgi:hypothetical protein
LWVASFGDDFKASQRNRFQFSGCKIFSGEFVKASMKIIESFVAAVTKPNKNYRNKQD